jgi:hypothetical protein
LAPTTLEKAGGWMGTVAGHVLLSLLLAQKLDPWWALLPIGVAASYWGVRAATTDRPIRRQLANAERFHPDSPRQSGQVVRVEGVVAAQPTVPTLFAGKPAVLFRNCVDHADETRGIDFWLDVGGGHRVKVLVYDALLLERPRRFRGTPACGPVSSHTDDGNRQRVRSDLCYPPRMWHRLLEPRLYESAICPGDRIDVTGVVHHQADPGGAAGPSRRVPLQAVIAGGPGLHVLVRKLA